jgi:hypothetical protein
MAVANMFTHTGYCYGMVSYKASHELWPVSDILFIPNSLIIIPDSSTGAVWLQQTHLVVKKGENWREMSVNITDNVSLLYSAGIFNMP